MPKAPPSSTPRDGPAPKKGYKVGKNGRLYKLGTIPGFHGKKGKSGLKKGKRNALKNGSKVDHQRLVVGELPRSMLAIKREARTYRRGLEAEVLNLKDEINLVDAHCIDTASAATMAAGIARWLLRQRIDEMSTNDIRGCGMDILKAKTKRDKAVKELGLDVKPEPLDLKDYIIESANGNGKSPKISDLNDRVVN